MALLTTVEVAKLAAPLPDEAITPNPKNKDLSSIKPIFVIDRLNEVFGVGGWQVRAEPIVTQGQDIVVKTILDIPDFGIHYESFGGNDNNDLGDAFKGAQTDGLTKMCSWLGIGIDVYRGKHKPTEKAPEKKAEPKTRPANKAATTSANLPELTPETKDWTAVLTRMSEEESDVTLETIKSFFTLTNANEKQLMKDFNRILIERAKEKKKNENK